MNEELSPVDKFYIWHEAELKEIEENGPRKRRGRKPSKKQYFTYITDQAINAYNQEEDYMKRNKIYKEHIHYAFNKLAENIINTFKFTYFDYGFEDIKHETVAFMVMNIHKYDHTKGSKAFS